MNKKEILKYLRENELNVQSAPAAIIALDLVYIGYIDSDKVHGVKYSPIFSHIYSKNIKPFYQIIPQKIITKVSRKIYSDYCKNPKSLENKIKKHKELQEELDILWKKRSKIEPLNFYKKFVKISRKWWQYGSIGEDKAEAINQEITPKFVKKYNLDNKKAQELVSVLSFPKEQSVFNLERKSFLEICIDVLNKKNSELKIKKYLKNYFWFKTNFYKKTEITSESVLKDVRSEIKKRSKKSISNELAKIDKHFKDILDQKKKISLEFAFTLEDKKDIYFGEQNTYWFDRRKEGMMIQLYYLFSFLENIAKKYNMDYDELASSRVEEVESFLQDQKKIKGTEKKRKEGGIFLTYEKNKKVKLFYNRDAQKMLDIALHSDEKGLKGQVACKGGLEKIKGRVNIILDPNKESFNKGEILVVSMTRIEFVPLMRKAKAIITNEGGIACHAAIVSRELGIPSIIGTKNATRILKNNDLVELNLKTGTIKIIK